MSILERALRMGEAKQFKAYEKRVERIGAWEPELGAARGRGADRAVRARCASAVQEEGESLDDVLAEAFALTREVGRRTMSMRHFDVQLIGGMVLHDGQIAEMRTGEGKTLTGTLAVVLNALAGKGVHVVTVNDYLARRDADWMRPIYRRPRPDRRRAPEQPALRGEARGLRRRHHLRHQLRVRLRLPARQHGHDAWRRRSSTAAASPRTASRSRCTTSRSSTRSTTSSSTRRARR